MLLLLSPRQDENLADGLLNILRALHKYIPYSEDGDKQKYSTALLRCVSFLSRQVSFLETRLVSFESFLVSRECTTSTNALHCGNTQSQRSNTVK